MKVYIVEEIGVHGTGSVVGVFETRQKAEEYKSPYPHPLLYLSVSEWEVR